MAVYNAESLRPLQVFPQREREDKLYVCVCLEGNTAVYLDPETNRNYTLKEENLIKDAPLGMFADSVSIIH